MYCVYIDILITYCKLLQCWYTHSVSWRNYSSVFAKFCWCIINQSSYHLSKMFVDITVDSYSSSGFVACSLYIHIFTMYGVLYYCSLNIRHYFDLHWDIRITLLNLTLSVLMNNLVVRYVLCVSYRYQILLFNLALSLHEGCI